MASYPSNRRAAMSQIFAKKLALGTLVINTIIYSCIYMILLDLFHYVSYCYLIWLSRKNFFYKYNFRGISL